MAPVRFCRKKKHVDLKKNPATLPKGTNNRLRGLVSTGSFKGHYFSFRCWSRGRQRRPQRRPGEGGKGGPYLRFCVLCSSCLPASLQTCEIQNTRQEQKGSWREESRRPAARAKRAETKVWTTFPSFPWPTLWPALLSARSASKREIVPFKTARGG